MTLSTLKLVAEVVDDPLCWKDCGLRYVRIDMVNQRTNLAVFWLSMAASKHQAGESDESNDMMQE